MQVRVLHALEGKRQDAGADAALTGPSPVEGGGWRFLAEDPVVEFLLRRGPVNGPVSEFAAPIRSSDAPESVTIPGR